MLLCIVFLFMLTCFNSYARPPTDRVLFHAHTTHLLTEALLLSGRMFATASQHTCVMKTLRIIVLGMNSKRN